MDNPKVSIIAPVFNVAPYLPNFIDSVINQTYSNWELLLVDDGATDGGGDICDQFAQRDNRIIVFHKPNGGVSSARNVGIKNMTGDWVIMPDPDDELPHESIETLLKFASDDIDLVSASYTMYRNGEIREPTKEDVYEIFSVPEFVSVMGKVPRPRNFDRRCCNKLFRVSIIKDNNILFPENLHYREDILYNYQYLSKCKNNVCCIPYSMYTYYRRDCGAAVSLQEKYSPKSIGRFTAMVSCYDYLTLMNAESEVKKRMKLEMLKSFNETVALIKSTGEGRNDLILMRNKFRKYFSLKERLVVYARKIHNKLNSIKN
ncbi:MAG: glycosyltransferase family 2 protein [Bacteroidales bacterium]|nr:glycosyltransferase family 2 protein [Bacteroidales bacterium]